jgi:CDP-diacylglycerol--glycerol-3-phosphate 3-phosphatidyltransferase
MGLIYQFKKEKFLSLPNMLSLSRLVLGIFLYQLIIQKQTVIALLVALIAIITDYADGYFARRRNEISEIGKILDPLSDKVAVALGTIAIYQVYDLPLWVVMVIIGRDILILFGSLLLIGKVDRVVPSEMPGKIAVTIISLLLLAYILELDQLKTSLLLFTAAIILISFGYYAYKFLKLFFTDVSKKNENRL